MPHLQFIALLFNLSVNASALISENAKHVVVVIIGVVPNLIPHDLLNESMLTVIIKTWLKAEVPSLICTLQVEVRHPRGSNVGG